MEINKSFHVVCEGITDFEVFKSIIDATGKKAGGRFRAQQLFPPPAHKDNGGWGNLKNWCLNQASALAGHNLRAAATLLHAKPARWASRSGGDKIAAALALNGSTQSNFLLIQLDTDIAEDLVVELKLDTQVDFPMSPRSRLQICKLAVDKWLGDHAAHVGSLIFYCFTSLALENWVLTLHSRNEIKTRCGLRYLPDTYDGIHEPDKQLIKLGHARESDGSLRKKQSIYKNHGQKIAAQLNVSRDRSFQLNEFCQTLLNA